MAETRILNKALWTNLTRLKLLAKPDAPVKFLLEHSPFHDHDDNDETFVEQDTYRIVGRIYPNSDIYKEGAFQIEIILTSRYPDEAPQVRFLTPVYHPNIGKDGKFCHQLISNASRWKKETTLVKMLQAVVKHIDEPDPDYATEFDIGKEYLENRVEFNRKALEMVKKYALPRTETVFRMAANVNDVHL